MSVSPAGPARGAPYSRSVSPSERLYLAAAELCPPFCIQLVVEGRGDLQLPQLERALALASVAVPGASLRRWGARWVTLAEPAPLRVLELQGGALLDHPWLRLPPAAGASAELLWLPGEPARLVFRVLHATMDGQGVLIWAQQLMRALRGEAPQSVAQAVDEVALRALAQGPHSGTQPGFRFRYSSPLGLDSPHDAAHSWVRRSIAGHHSALVARLAARITDYCGQPTRFMVPADLRRHLASVGVCPGLSSANLTLPLFVAAQPGASWRALHGQLLRDLLQRRELAHSPSDPWVQRLPLRLLRAALAGAWGLTRRRGRYPLSGILSHLGRVELAQLSGAGFMARAAFTLPVHVPLSPLNLTALQADDVVELVLCVPDTPTACTRAEALLDALEQALRPPRCWADWAGNLAPQQPRESATLIQALQVRAAQQPQRLALIQGHQTLSYGALMAAAEALSNDLIAQGVQPGELVAVVATRQIETVVAMVAVLQVGASYLPLNPSAPAASTRQRRRLAGARLCIQGGVLSCDPTFPTLPADPARAYVIFTSGTTGSPRGVPVHHGSLLNYLHWAIGHYQIDANTRFALFGSLSVDLSITALWAPLLAGGAVELFPGPTDLSQLSQVMTSKCTALKLTPTQLSLLLGLGLSPAPKRLLVVGGESWSVGSAAGAQRLFGADCRLFNEYGPTEATVGCLAHRFNPLHDLGGSVPIGRPVANTRVWLVDPAGQEQRPELPGELCVSGPGVCHGYLGAEPAGGFFLAPDGARAYRTGDRARLQDGVLVYEGRVDRQLKLSGYRVEPAEIEAALCSLDGVRGAHARLEAGVLVAHVASERAALELTQALRERLPSHQVPRRVLLYADLPCGPSGKLDLARLSAPIAVHEPASADVADTPLLQIRRLWSATLGVPLAELHPQSDFNELGGDSLALLRMWSELAQALVPPPRHQAFYASLSQFAASPTLGAALHATQPRDE